MGVNRNLEFSEMGTHKEKRLKSTLMTGARDSLRRGVGNESEKATECPTGVFGKGIQWKLWGVPSQKFIRKNVLWGGVGLHRKLTSKGKS